MEIPSDGEQVITKVVERPWEASIAQAVQVMKAADIETLGFKCKIGDERFEVALTLTELSED